MTAFMYPDQVEQIKATGRTSIIHCKVCLQLVMANVQNNIATGRL